MELGMFRIALSLLVCLSFSAQGADKYTDENRPYEFGFTIDGQQHRHEKKDKDGIIMGEFGFVTADDVYHVTVYATDKEGRFKIISMKNIHLKSSKAGLGPTAPARQGHSLALPPATSSAATLSPPSQQSSPRTQSVSLEPPARSCSSCSIPTTTTRAPPPAPPNQFGSPNYGSTSSQSPSSLSQPQGFGGQQNSFVNNGNNPQQGILNPQGNFGSSQPNQGGQNYPGSQNGFAGTPNNAPGLSQNGYGNAGNGDSSSPQLGPGTLNSEQGVGQSPNPQVGSRSQFGAGGSGLQPPYPQTGTQQLSNSQRGPGSQPYPQGGEPLSYPGGGLAVQSSNPQLGPGSQSSSSAVGSGPQSANPQNGPGSQSHPQGEEQLPYPQGGSAVQSSNPQLGPEPQGISPAVGSGPQSAYPSQGGPSLSSTYPSQGEVQPSYPQGGNSAREQSPPFPRPNGDQSHPSQGEPGIRTSKKYDGSPQQNNPNTSPVKPTLVSAQMQIVDKNTDIHSLRPGETEGLPPGLNQDDMTQLLYTFNYTVGFHGHFEEGFASGVKRGYYYATGRNGVKTRIDYTADSTGFHPKVSQEVLDLISEEVPKPETEKDAKYGLKGYEFKWLYYPVGSKR